MTLKPYPLWDRDWETAYAVGNEITDSFAPKVMLTIKEGVLSEVKPLEDFNESGQNDISGVNWLTDKGRLFVEALYSTRGYEGSSNVSDWDAIFKKIITNYYYKNFTDSFTSSKNPIIVAFNHASMEIISLLSMFEQSLTSFKIRRVEDFKTQNLDQESEFQLNGVRKKSQLFLSTLCLMMGVNPRFEGSSLNQLLRQRYFRGNFKLLSLGPSTDLTVPKKNLGSNLKITQSISEGNHTACSDISTCTNPMVILSNELSRQDNFPGLLSILRNFSNHSTKFNIRSGLNMLSSSSNDVGTSTISKIKPLSQSDLNNCDSIYMLSSPSTQNLPNLEKLYELKLLNSSWLGDTSNFSGHSLAFNQNSGTRSKTIKMPGRVLFEDDETFINTEGIIRRVPKLINLQDNRKSNWQILRKFFLNFCESFLKSSIAKGDAIFYGCQNLFNFRNYVNFHFQSTQNLTSLNYFFNVQNRPNRQFSNPFKVSTQKVLYTKIKYWIDEFFSGGKDGYTQNSSTINNCSRLARVEGSNFF